MPAPSTPVHAPTTQIVGATSSPTGEAGAEAGGAGTSGSSGQGPKDKFHPKDFGMYAQFEDIVQDGKVVGRKLKEIEFNSELRTRFEDILDVFAAQIEEYQRVTGNALPEQQRDFINLYKQNKKSLLDTAHGWSLANLVMEQEIRLRLAKLQQDIYLEIKGMQSPTGEITLTKHNFQGFLNKYGLDILSEAVFAASDKVSLPIVGVIDWFKNARKNESMKIKMKDFAIDFAALPQGYREYMDYIDPRGTDPRGVAYFLEEVVNARLDFYQSLGADLVALGQSTPWERFFATTGPGGVAIAADPAKAREKLDTEWMRVRAKHLKEIFNEGMSPGVPWVLTNPSQVGWITFEAQRRTIKEFMTPFLNDIVKSQSNTLGTISVIDARLGETASPEAAQKEKQKKIDTIKAKIEKIRGRSASEGIPEVPGELPALEAELARLEKEISPEGGQSLREQTETSRRTHVEKEAELKGLRKVISDQQARLARLQSSISTREAHFENSIRKIQESPSYKTDLALYKSMVAGGLRTVKDIEADIQEIQSQYTEVFQHALGQLGDNPDPNQIQVLQASFTNQASIATRNLRSELDQSKRQWRKLERFFTKEKRVSSLHDDKKTAVRQINDDMRALDSEIAAKQADLRTKEAEEDKLKSEYGRNKSKLTPLEQQVRSTTRAIDRKRADLSRLLAQLAEANEIDASELGPKIERKREMWTALSSALNNFDRIVAEVQAGVSAEKKSLEIAPLTSTTTKREYGRDYLEGHLKILDHIFKWDDAKDRDKLLAVASKLLPSTEFARILVDRFNLNLAPASRRSLTAVFTAMHGRSISQYEFSKAFMAIHFHLKRKAQLIT